MVCDAALEGVGQRLKEILAAAADAEPVLIVAEQSRRDHPALLGRIRSGRPELMVDLMALTDEPAAAPEADTFTIWAVHEALWPQDRQNEPATDRPSARYRAHQYQNLALGSLLRTALGRQFPDRIVLYQLAP